MADENFRSVFLGIEIGIEIGISILIEWTRDRIEIGSIRKFELIEDRDRMALGSGSTEGLVKLDCRQTCHPHTMRRLKAGFRNITIRNLDSI